MKPAAAETPGDSILEERAYAKATRRLVPLLFFAYVSAFLDRVNVGYAKLQMAADLHFSDAVYGFGAGIFFIGYFLIQVPGNLVLQRIGARRWLGGSMIVWGLISAAMWSVKTAGAFYVLRFVLGMAEGGFFPGTILFLTTWYPARRRARIIASFMTAIALSGVIGSPLSGWIMNAFSGRHGWSGWQWLFVLEAIPSVSAGILVLIGLTDSIDVAGWLSSDEKSLLRAANARDLAAAPVRTTAQLLAGGQIWRLTVINFTMTFGLYGISFWLPQIIANTGVKTLLQVGLLGAIPYGTAAIAMIALGRRSDRMSERRWNVVASTGCGALGLILTGIFGDRTFAALTWMTLATAGTLAAIPVYWAWASSSFQGTAAAVSIGCISALGNLAGFFGPYIIGLINDATHRTAPGLYAIAVSLAVAIVLVVITPSTADPAGARPGRSPS